MASLVSSSLKTSRLIFIRLPGSQWGCCPQHGHLNAPDLSDIDDTDDEVDTVLLSLSNSWSDESEGDWVEPPITLVVSGLDSSLAAVPSLTPAVLPKVQAGATSHHSAVTRRLAGHGDKS